MRKFKWHLSIELGGTREGMVEVDDDATDEEIEEVIKEDVFNFIDWGYYEVIEEDDKDEG